MAWLTDPRKWDDAWWAGLSYGARMVWEACLTSQFRTVLPGLCYGVSAATLHDVCAIRIRRLDRRMTVDQVAEDLAELLVPDEQGKVHFCWDPATRVTRIPMAPAYNHADNPNVLTAWYRAWRHVPDCALKFDHIASLRLGVNFGYRDKRGRASMADKWTATFGQPEQAFLDGGRQLKTYVDLRERWVTTGTHGDTPPETPGDTHQGTLFPESASGSGIRDQGSGIRDRDQGSGINRVSYTPGDTHDSPPTSVVSPQKQSRMQASSNGDGNHGARGVGNGAGRNGAGNGAGGGPGTAPWRVAGGGRPGDVPAGDAPAPRKKLPTGSE